MQSSTLGDLGRILGNAGSNFNANAGDFFGGFGRGSGGTSRKQKRGGSGYDFNFDFIGGGSGYDFDFDFIGGNTTSSRPRKRKKSRRKK